MSQVSSMGVGVKDSRYFDRFERLAAAEVGFQLVGDMMLVERLPPIESKTSSGLIIPTGEISTYKSTAKDAVLELGLVLMVGQGDIDDDGDRLMTSCQPGDIVELPMNVSWYSQFGNLLDYVPYSIGKMRDAQALIVFRDYEKVFEVLNAKG